MARSRCLVAWLAALFVTCLASSTAAQFDAVEASKELKAELKQVGKEHQATLKAEQKGLRAALKAAALPFKAGDAGTGDVADVFDELVAFQSDVFLSATEADNAFSSLSVLLFDFEDDGDTPEFYPRDFSIGAGGRIDDFIAGVQARAERLYPSVRRQLAALVRLAEKKSGLLLSVRLFPVSPMREPTVNDDGSFFVVSLPAHIDIAVAVSDPDEPSFNRIHVSGTMLFDGTGATLALAGPVDIDAPGVPIEPTTARFEHTFTFKGGLPPGNYTIRARSGPDDTSSVVAISVR